jgi:hypothetical protein
VYFTDAQLEEFAVKRESLEAARAMYSAGEYDRALKAYDAYLVKYPGSPVAKEERAEVKLALDAETRGADSTVNVPAKRPKKPAASPKDTTKRPWWRRVFGRQ